MLALFYQMKTAKKKTIIEIEEYYNSLLNKRKMTTNNSAFICRICLSEDSTKSVYNAESTTGIVEALHIFADIRVSKDDEYSTYLCNTCLKFIRGAISFRRVAKLSEKTLKQSVMNVTCIESDHCGEDYFESNEPQKYTNDDLNTLNDIKTTVKVKVKCTPKVTCHVCNKVLNRSYYKEHMTMHDPDHKKYICDVCGKSFRLRCAYHNHSLRHREDFPYKCQFCPYRGRYSELLKTHMRTHTGDYRYMCTECPARFLFKSNLNSHMLKHKEPLFKCDACKRAFHTKLTLQRHYEADHLRIKNHVCNMCGKAFGYRNAMMKHQRHVHKREKMLYGRMPSYLEAERKNQDN